MERDAAYALLGLEEGASVEDLKAAYRQQLRTVHPDAHDEDARTGAEASLRAVIEAYQFLSQPVPLKSAQVETSVLPSDEPASEFKVDEDDYEIPAAIVSLVSAVGIFGVSMWLLTSHIMPRGISNQATAYSFVGLFVLWGLLYGAFCPVFEARARRRALQKLNADFETAP